MARPAQAFAIFSWEINPTEIFAAISQAQTGWLYFLKEFVILPIVREVANKIQNKIENKVLQLTSKMNGKTPQFITNWRTEVMNNLGQSNDIFRTVIANTKFCPQFDQGIKTVFGADKYTGATTQCVDQCTQQAASGSGCNACVNACATSANPDTCSRNCALQGVTDPGIQSVINNQSCSDKSCYAYLCSYGYADKCQAQCQTQIGQKTLVPGSAPFQTTANCTLSPNFNPTLFAQDFNKGGGWDAWTKSFAQQNTFSGALLLSYQQLAIQTGINTQAHTLQSQTSQGFRPVQGTHTLSPGGITTGTGNAVTNNTQYCLDQCIKANPKNSSACYGQCYQTTIESCPPDQKVAGRCIFQSDILTPGNLLGTSAANAIDKKIGKFGLGAQQITDIVGALLDAVITSVSNTLTDFGSGNGKIPEIDYSASSGDLQADPSKASGCFNTCVAGKQTACNAITDSTQQAQCNATASMDCTSQCENSNSSATTPKKLGDTCTDTDACGAKALGLFCSTQQANICVECDTADQCSATGDTCSNGVCVQPGGNIKGGLCMTNNECAADYFCNSNKHCRPTKDISTVQGTSIGDNCSSDSATSCGTDGKLFCSIDTDKCIQCDQDDPAKACASGQTCSNDGVCLVPGGNDVGAFCISNSQCKPSLICTTAGTCQVAVRDDGSSVTPTPGPGGTGSTPTPTPTTSGGGVTPTPTPTPTTGGGTSSFSIAGSSTTITVDPTDPLSAAGTLIMAVTGAPANATGSIVLTKGGATQLTSPITSNASGAVDNKTTSFTFEATDYGSWQAIASFGSQTSAPFSFTVQGK